MAGQNPALMIRDRHIVHACPLCEIGNARPLCELCLGAGNVTEPRLAGWQNHIAATRDSD
jgi:hypothetical protein